MAVLQGASAGTSLQDAEAYPGGYDFGGPRNPADNGPRPLVRGGSLSRGFALPLQVPGVLCIICHVVILATCTTLQTAAET